MKLSLYLKIKDIDIAQFAKMLGLSRPYLSLVVYQRKSPSRQIAKRIQEMTEGYVTANELLYPEDYETINPDEILRMISDYEKKNIRNSEQENKQQI